MLDLRTVTSHGRSRPKGMRATAVIAAAILMGAALGACSSDSAGDATGDAGGATAQQEAEQPSGDDSGADTSTGDDAGDTGDDEAGADSTGEGVFAGVPVIDGEITYNMSGTLTNGETDYRNIGVASGLTTQDAADQVRDQLTGAGLTELAWAATEDDEGASRTRALYEHKGVVLILDVDPDGEVSYDAREMPAGSFAEQEFACGLLHTISTESMTFTLMPIVTGNPVTEQDVDFTFAYSDALDGRVPADVSAALAALQDAASQTVGLPVEDLGPGTAPADAITEARDALQDAGDGFCSA